MEKSFVLIKPDAVERNLIGKILTCYESKGLKIGNLKYFQVDRTLAERHYAEHKEKPFFNELIEYITRSPLCAVVLLGENSVERVRQINGVTDPKEAEEGTIRNLYGLSKGENSVHSSDCPENAKKEIEIWFGK